MFSKVLVANRGEIAIRAFRAGYELGAKTVAVFPHEDRNSIHRQKADEAYLIGEEGHPVRAYLDVDEIVRVAGLEVSAVDATHEGLDRHPPERQRRSLVLGLALVPQQFARKIDTVGNLVAKGAERADPLERNLEVVERREVEAVGR